MKRQNQIITKILSIIYKKFKVTRNMNHPICTRSFLGLINQWNCFEIHVYCTVIRKTVLETDGSRIYDLRSQYVSKCMGNMVHDILIITDTLCFK